MNSQLIQLLVLAGIAVFLIMRLKNVLGTRDGHEQQPQPKPQARGATTPEFEVIEGGPDLDITDHVDENSAAAKALSSMKRIEPFFNVTEFLGGARSAYEMIVMGYEKGELSDIQPFLAEDIYESFVDGIAAREDQGLTVESDFIGVRELTLVDATLDADNQEAELTIRFVAELTSVVRNAEGEIIDGAANEIKRQKDTWSFARAMGTDDPNWLLVSTDA
ncbi:Tim44/TimA family putative adaptor protein [Roseobacter sp.]|uniref:Tim44/TimA family putative adaptor protein n=1 Tax=Roseobacter sp. TaxID=1907202 RepID=UPI003297417F